jgi:bifunctional UDP-N-acetylglucosamine pyrophosphorylase/glucosamine-1-phosphate N-acetyltransferase
MTILPIILAGGQGTRMQSALPKVLHPIAGKAMIQYVLDAVADVTDEKPIVVVGHGADKVRDAVSERAMTAVQQQQLGTADAVEAARALAQGKGNLVLVAYSDMPCLRADTIHRICELQQQNASAFSMLTTIQEDSHGFGRILRNADGSVAAIVEEAQATAEQLLIKECNVGLYCFDADWLWESLPKIKLSPKGEYYLTDLVEIANQENRSVQALILTDIEEALGVNTRVHLSEAEAVIRRRINLQWMSRGVTMIDPQTTYISPEVQIERDVTIYPNCWIEGKTLIQTGSSIGPFVLISNCSIGKNAMLQTTAVRNTIIPENEVRIGGL